MEKINIICVDDQREVLSAVLQDLSPLAAFFNIEDCESALEAQGVMDDLDAEGDYVALVISDHVMPEKSGVEFLTEVSQESRFRKTKKILLTGQATHQDTITAINRARVESYLEKPWKSDELLGMATTLVTEYIFDNGIDYQPYQEILDQAVVLQRLR